MYNNALVKYTILCSVRDKLFLSLFVILLFVVFFSLFLGNTLLVEQNQSMIIYCAYWFRLALVFFMVNFVGVYTQRLYETGEIMLIASKAIRRSTIVISLLLSFVILIFVNIVPIFILMMVLGVSNLTSLLIWLISLFLETTIMVAMALAISMIFEKLLITVIFSAAFYLLSRVSGLFLLSHELSINNGVNDIILSISSVIMKVINVVLPRFDLLGQTNWLIYSNYDVNLLVTLFLQILFYVVLLISITIIDFNKKQI